MDITQLLKDALEKNATDIHLTVGAPPTIRVDSSLGHLSEDVLSPEDTTALVEQVLDEEKKTQFDKNGEVDLSYSSPGVGRFRVNIYHQRGAIGLAIRVINTVVPDIASLGVPDIVSKMVHREKGLILVTGPSNSGKSTTVAGIINLINEEMSRHIITLEDPIEYLHKHKKSIINQREIGLDSPSISQGLRAALRQDPDVILVGELTDSETINLVLAAAETGRLVISSLHTPDVSQSIERVIDGFPPDQKEQMRVQFANTLIGVVAQRLLPRKDGQGKVVAVEFLAVSPVVRNLIRDGKIEQIDKMMQGGVRSGMRSMDKHIQQLFEKGMINEEEALDNATDRGAMSRFLSNRPEAAKSHETTADQGEL